MGQSDAEPLAASLSFGGRSGAVSIAAESDAEGRFTAQLAREGEWDVDVVASEPKIFRRLRKVPVSREPGTSRAWVEIELADTVLEGEVVDEAGTAVPEAAVLVLVFPAVEMPSTVRTDENGHFELRGFEPGAFRLEARAKGKFGQRTSETVEVHIDEEKSRAEVKLVVRDVLEIRGRVVGSGGSGVPGASILARPVLTTGVAPLIPPQTMTDVAGGFVLSFSPGVSQADTTIIARGFLLTRRQLSVDPSQEWNVLLEPATNGGELKLVFPQPIGDGFEGKSHPFVVHDGTIDYDLGLLGRWAYTNGVQPTKGALIAPAMPAGSYALCRSLPRSPEEKEGNSPPGGECVSGFLAPEGELSLELGSASASNR